MKKLVRLSTIVLFTLIISVATTSVAAFGYADDVVADDIIFDLLDDQLHEIRVGETTIIETPYGYFTITMSPDLARSADFRAHNFRFEFTNTAGQRVWGWTTTMWVGVCHNLRGITYSSASHSSFHQDWSLGTIHRMNNLLTVRSYSYDATYRVDSSRWNVLIVAQWTSSTVLHEISWFSSVSPR